MTKENFIQFFLKLGRTEKIRLAQDLWDIAAQEPEATDLTEEQKYELERRLAAVEANPSLGIDWSEALREIRANR